MNKKNKILLTALTVIAVISLVLVAGASTGVFNLKTENLEKKRLLQNVDEVKMFIEAALSVNNQIWDYYGIQVKLTKSYNDYDLYRVYGNVEMENIDNILVWKQFRQDLKVYETTVKIENMEYY
jgi:hypothetical protein